MQPPKQVDRGGDGWQNSCQGEVPERSNGAVSKCVICRPSPWRFLPKHELSCGLRTIGEHRDPVSSQRVLSRWVPIWVPARVRPFGFSEVENAEKSVIGGLSRLPSDPPLDLDLADPYLFIDIVEEMGIARMASMGRLGQLEELVLRALVRLQENAYGVTIRRELVERARHDVSFGTVYTTLERLQRKGYVSSRMGDPTPERGGRAKRYFRIEAPGITALNSSREMIARMGGLVHVG